MPHKKSKAERRKGSKSKSKKSIPSKPVSLKQRPASQPNKDVTPIEYTGPRVYSAPQKNVLDSGKYVTNPGLPYVRPTTPEPSRDELLTDFLSKCSPGSSGSYVNQGTYGVGLKYQITQPGVDPPFEYLTLSHLMSQAMPDNRNIFIKFVPLTEPPPADEFISEFNKSLPTQRCQYEDDEGDVVTGRLAAPPQGWTEDNDLSVGARLVKFEKFRGFKWNLECNNNIIGSTYIGQFLEECTSQIDMFKKTNHNLDSFIIPIYESLVITQDNIHIIEQLKDCYHFRGPNYDEVNANFFDTIIMNLRKSKYFKMGIIVMPMMPFPPITTGWDYLYQKKCYKRGYRELLISNFADKYADDYFIYNYNDTNLTIDGHRSLLFISQLISHMITLLEEGIIHGDLHPGNTLMNPELSNTSDGQDDANLSGKAFLIDFGTVVKDGNWIPWASEADDYKRFKLQIKALLVSRGAHGYSPLEYYTYDWLPSLFLKRTNTGRYNILDYYDAHDLANSDMILLEDDENGISPYNFVEENFKTMFEWVNEFKRGNREFIDMSAPFIESHKELFDKIRAFNKSGNTRSTIRGGEKESINKMIGNLKYGEQSLNALKEEYSDAVNLMVQKPASVKKSKNMKRKNMKSKINKTRKPQSKVSKKTKRQTAKIWKY
jgi:hypothetical protein